MRSSSFIILIPMNVVITCIVHLIIIHFSSKSTSYYNTLQRPNCHLFLLTPTQLSLTTGWELTMALAFAWLLETVK